MFAGVKILNHFATLLDNFWMFIGFENYLEKLFFLHPLSELVLWADYNAVLERVDKFFDDQVIEILDFVDSSQFFL